MNEMVKRKYYVEQMPRGFSNEVEVYAFPTKESRKKFLLDKSRGGTTTGHTCSHINSNFPSHQILLLPLFLLVLQQILLAYKEAMNHNQNIRPVSILFVLTPLSPPLFSHEFSELGVPAISTNISSIIFVVSRNVIHVPFPAP